jgi:hypothetical protein
MIDAARSSIGSLQALAEALFALAGVYKDRGRNLEAAELLRKVLDLIPGHPGATQELRLLPIADRIAR